MIQRADEGRLASVDAPVPQGIFEADRALLPKEPEMYDLRNNLAIDAFAREQAAHIERLHRNGLPRVLATSRQRRVVVQSAEAYRALLVRLERAEAQVGISRETVNPRDGDLIPVERFTEQLLDAGQADPFEGGEERPHWLIVNGRPELVAQGIDAYRALLKRVDYAECVIGIREGRASFERGEGLPLDEAFAEIRRNINRRVT